RPREKGLARCKEVAGLTRLPLTHQARNSLRIGITLGFERGYDTGAVGCRAVLAQLVLAFEPGDSDLEPDYALQHAPYISCRKIAHFPCHRIAGFVTLGQAIDRPVQPFVTIDHAHRPTSMHIDVVPGRHTRAARIPIGRDVGVRPVKNRQDLATSSEIGNLRVGTREVTL